MFILDEDKKCLKQKNYKDLEIVVSEYITENNLTYNDVISGDIDELSSISSTIEIIFKQIYCEDEMKSDLTDLINLMLKCYFASDAPVYNASDIAYLDFKIRQLEKIPQPEQRTPEWYTFRNNRLTASDLWYVVDDNKAKIYDILKKKCGEENPFIPGKAIIHGVKFEPVATSLYEKMNDVEILEFGCLPHSFVPFFGASPDGICGPESRNKNYVGRMLEIKCPKSRVITGFIPEVYQAQMQGQLEVCDLDYCDYLECEFQMYSSQEEFLGDIFRSTNGTDVVLGSDNTGEKSHIQPQSLVDINKTSKGNYKGAIVEIYDTSTKKTRYEYYYGGFKTTEECDKWEEKYIDEILASETLEHLGTTYWYLNNYSCVLVKRDKDWFSKNFHRIQAFWDSVEHARIHGIPEKEKRGKKQQEPPKIDMTQFTGTIVDTKVVETIMDFNHSKL